MCKPNYADTVKRNMSGGPLLSSCCSLRISSIFAKEQRHSAQKELDNQPHMYIIIFTRTRHGRPAKNQTVFLARARHAESSHVNSAARELSRQRDLRFGRQKY